MIKKYENNGVIEMIAVTTDFNEAFLLVLENIAKSKGMSVSKFIQETMYKRIEDEEDLREAEAILADEDDEIISHEEFWRGL